MTNIHEDRQRRLSTYFQFCDAAVAVENALDESRLVIKELKAPSDLPKEPERENIYQFIGRKAAKAPLASGRVKAITIPYKVAHVAANMGSFDKLWEFILKQLPSDTCPLFALDNMVGGERTWSYWIPCQSAEWPEIADSDTVPVIQIDYSGFAG